MSVRLSAWGLGLRSFCSSLARMKLSIGLLAQVESFTTGTAGLVRDCQDQWVLLESDQAFSATEASRGSGAPIFIHASRSAIMLSGSLFPLGGIWRSGSVYRTALISRLCSGSPGRIAGPVSPPFKTPFLLSSKSPPLTFSAWALWHL